ncbi:hypothetical protein, partial [Brucella lupini]|uniref:hypothetical protein n=1 Tax=Brucella lupini TaxID=255457 RepID=UPI001ABF8272
KFQLSVAQNRGAPHLNPENSSSPWPKIGVHLTKTAGANSKLDKTWGQGQRKPAKNTACYRRVQ